MIYRKVLMTELPRNCFDCTETRCTLPLKLSKGCVGDMIVNKYLTKRHELCPLIEIEPPDSWISTSDEADLPNIGKSVIITDGVAVFEASRVMTKTGWAWTAGVNKPTVLSFLITHWMKKPEPPVDRTK